MYVLVIAVPWSALRWPPLFGLRSWRCGAFVRAWLLEHLFGIVAQSPRRRRRASRAKPRGPRVKPDWVAEQVLNLAARLKSQREAQRLFNRLYGHRCTVSHNWVNELCRASPERIAALRREQRRQVPRWVPPGKVWGLDSTVLATPDGRKLLVLGIIDHGSRMALYLKA